LVLQVRELHQHFRGWVVHLSGEQVKIVRVTREFAM
jgi:hypothetical protein